MLCFFNCFVSPANSKSPSPQRLSLSPGARAQRVLLQQQFQEQQQLEEQSAAAAGGDGSSSSVCLSPSSGGRSPLQVEQDQNLLDVAPWSPKARRSASTISANSGTYQFDFHYQNAISQEIHFSHGVSAFAEHKSRDKLAPMPWQFTSIVKRWSLIRDFLFSVLLFWFS